MSFVAVRSNGGTRLRPGAKWHLVDIGGPQREALCGSVVFMSTWRDADGVPAHLRCVGCEGWPS